MAKLIKASRSRTAPKNKTLNIEELNKHKAEAERKPFLTRLRNSTFAYIFYGISAFGFYTGATTAYNLAKPKSKVISVAYADEFGYKISQEAEKILGEKLKAAFPDGHTTYKKIKAKRQEIIEYIKQRADGANISEENLKRLIKEEAKRRFELIFHAGGELDKLNEQFLNNTISQEEYFSRVVPLMVDAELYVPLMFDSEDELNEMLNKVNTRANAIDREINDLMYKINNYECEDRDACIRDAEALIKQHLTVDSEKTALSVGEHMRKLYIAGKKEEEARRRAEEAGREAKKWEQIQHKLEKTERLLKKAEDW